MRRCGKKKLSFVFIFCSQAFVEERFMRSKRPLFLLSPNCYLLFVICTAKKSFLETVILLYCNAWELKLALSKKTVPVLVFQESETYFSFPKTVIL